MKLDYSLVLPIPLGMVKAFAIRGEQVLLVDTGYPGSASRIISCLNNNGIAEEQVGMILITHGHDDHFGDAEALKKLTGAPVAVHRLDTLNLSRGENGILEPIGTKGKLAGSVSRLRNKEAVPKIEADIIIEENMNLENFGIPGEIIHTPGHTPGSLSIVLDNGEAIIGDLLFGGMIISRLPGYPFFASNRLQLRSSVKEVLTYTPEVIYASHGGPFTPVMIENFLRFTETKR